jgi:dipeptidyl aminopeptidase/acylaminoacyl peptidase
VTVSRDCSRIAFVEGFGSDRTIMTGSITTAAINGSEVERLADELQVVGLRWLDNDRLAYVGLAGVQTGFGVVEPDGTIDEAWRGDATIGATHRLAASCDSEGRIWAASKEGPNEPPELATFQIADGAWTRVTSLNAHLVGRASSTVNRITWRSDYDEIEGLLILPTETGPGPLPLVVIVHGGPTAAWTYAFSHGYMHLGLLLAENGYAVLLPNPRGSSGRGHAFARANVGDLGGGDLRDILAAVDLLGEQGTIEPTRVGITGGSYGGFMSTWAPTQTDAFAAAVAFAVVTDWLSMHNTTNIGRFDELYLDSDPYDPNGQYFSLSPIVHSRNCRTPVLILHGALDLCCPLGQAQEMYQALMDAGCVTELIVYARGGHGWTDKQYLLDTWQRTKDWFDRYLVRAPKAEPQPLEGAAS